MSTGETEESMKIAETPTGGAPAYDWEAIERLPQFQELTTDRRRFAYLWGGLGTGLGALYVVLASTAHGLMGTKLAGSISLGFAGGVGLILVTWAITIAYMRRSDRVWAPLEASIREQVLGRPEPEARRGRFTRRAPDPIVTATPDVR
jgi:uncharacterized membrane protein (DUF485 family)